MTLAYVQAADPGALDAFLADVADRVVARGLRVAGAVQHTDRSPGGARGEMRLRLLPLGGEIVISQRLGAAAQGCRLDPGALEAAVMAVAAALQDDTQLLILNKFGKQEADGRGFAPLIADAMGRDIPVLLGVNAKNFARFQAFEGGMALPLPLNASSVLTWCLGHDPVASHP